MLPNAIHSCVITRRASFVSFKASVKGTAFMSDAVALACCHCLRPAPKMVYYKNRLRTACHSYAALQPSILVVSSKHPVAEVFAAALHVVGPT